MGEALLMNHKRKKKPEGLKYYDTLTSIGSSETLDGATYNEAGYFGTVPASELFTGTELANEVGITQGNVQFDNVDWLKFYIDGKLLFVPQKTIRHSIAWDTINNAMCADGGKTVVKNGTTFKVRLFKTSTSEIYNQNTDTYDSEWNRLMLPIHEHSVNQEWKYQTYVSPSKLTKLVPNWGVDLSDDDLNLIHTSGSGSGTWCYEQDSTGKRCYRGLQSISYWGSYASNIAYATMGWRPVLEVVPPTEGGK